MNCQQIFDEIANHLITQGAPSVNDNGECMYRGEDDRKCAIGAIIPDDMYDASCEEGIPYEWGGTSASSDWSSDYTKRSLAVRKMIPNEYKNSVKKRRLLYALQSDVHDLCAVEYEAENYVAQLKYHLKKVAKEFNLDYKGVQQ